MKEQIVAGVITALIIAAGAVLLERAAGGFLIEALGGATDAELAVVSEQASNTTEAVETLSVEVLRQCRVCFRETEGGGNSNQCTGARDTCSAWVRPGEIDPDWTEPFRDNTDNRAGGCLYQWRLQCR